MVRFAAFSSGKKPQFAVCHFFVRRETAFCGKLFFSRRASASCGLPFFRQAQNRNLRFSCWEYLKPHHAVYSSPRDFLSLSAGIFSSHSYCAIQSYIDETYTQATLFSDIIK